METIPKRRRRENKTDYKLRFNILKSEKPRIVIRKTNRYILMQIIESKEAKDKVIAGVTSKDLIKEGWNIKASGSLKSIPAAYLTGMLLAKKSGAGDYILDIGMARNISGSRIFAAAKGLVDGGLKIPANEKVFPSEKKINGEFVSKEAKESFEKVKAKLMGKTAGEEKKEEKTRRKKNE